MISGNRAGDLSRLFEDSPGWSSLKLGAWSQLLPNKSLLCVKTSVLIMQVLQQGGQRRARGGGVCFGLCTRGVELRQAKEALRGQGVQKPALLSSAPGEVSGGTSAHLQLG